jgi:hypothetical protein
MSSSQTSQATHAQIFPSGASVTNSGASSAAAATAASVAAGCEVRRTIAT